MTKHKHHIVLNRENITFFLKRYGFEVLDYKIQDKKIQVLVYKDYSTFFNIEFNGKIELEITINPNLSQEVNLLTYPTFKEVSNIIPKKAFYHITKDGCICFAPPSRPMEEKWQFSDFLSSIDAYLFNYFTTEYIGQGELFELEHGQLGLEQYEIIKRRKG